MSSKQIVFQSTWERGFKDCPTLEQARDELSSPFIGFNAKNLAAMLFHLYETVDLVQVTEFQGEMGTVHVNVYGESDTPQALADLFYEVKPIGMQLVFHCI